MMEQNSNPVSSNSSLCRSGCGFYGNSATNGLCSKCYKDELKRKQSTSVPGTTAGPSASSSHGTSSSSPPSSSGELSGFAALEQESVETAVPTVQISTTTCPSKAEEKSSCLSNPIAECDLYELSSSDVDTSERDPKNDEDGQKDFRKKNKCNICRKKLGLTGFQCRCGGFYCSSHRYSNEHNCSFDYKALGAQEIKKNNPVVVAEKVKKL